MTSLTSHSPQLRLGADTTTLAVGSNTLQQLPHTLEACGTDAVVVVADQLLWQTHSENVSRLLGNRATAVHPVCAAKHARAPASVADVSERAAALQGRRRCVVGFGGGTVLKLAGVLAHLIDWGAPLILVPTTLLAMVDAAPSARHALATAHRPSTLGVLHPPTAILCDTRLLATLPEAAMREGVVEVLKAALAVGGDDAERLATAIIELPLDAPNADALRDFVVSAIALKARVLVDDPGERTVGLALHYGHTFSRALEIAMGPDVRHGLALAAGMLLAGRVAEALGLLPPAARGLHDTWIQRAVGLQQQPELRSLLDATHDDNFVSLLVDDPKRRLVTQDVVPLVLLQQLGHVHTPAGLSAPVTAVPPSVVATAHAAART